jgi:glycosyltransferase involved in cell wall biosynthesis
MPPDVIAIPVPNSSWGRLDVTCPWEAFVKGCRQESIVSAAKEWRPDVLVGVDWHSVEVCRQLSAAITSDCTRYRNLPFIYSNYRVYLRSATNAQDREFYARMEGQACAMAVNITVLSSSDAAFVNEHFSFFHPEGNHATHHQTAVKVILPPLRADIHAIPLLTMTGSASAHSVERVSQAHRKYITCVVRASREKEPHRFVDLICELQRRGTFSRCNLVPLVAGAGWAVQNDTDKGNDNAIDYVSKLCQRLASCVPNCRVMKQFLGPREMADIYAQTLLNIHPCHYDAYGMTVVEAASQGAPTLLDGDGVGAAELLRPDHGLCFSVDLRNASVAMLADEVERLLNDPALLMRVGTAAMKMAREWTEEANGRALATVLRDAIASCRDSPEDDGSKHGFAGTRGGVDVWDASNLSCQDFTERYLSTGQPVILRGIADDWRAAKEWVTPAGDVDIRFLEENFGEAPVPVTDVAPLLQQLCGGKRQDMCSTSMSLAEYCRWWSQHCAARSCKTTTTDAFNSDLTGTGTSEGSESRLYYLKDWHFVAQYPWYDAYTCPTYFRDDWLNEWLDAAHRDPSSSEQHEESVSCSSKHKPQKSETNTTAHGPGLPAGSASAADYRFVYLGPSGSMTPLHADVLRSHSWSTNVTGRKRWRLLPAKYKDALEDMPSGLLHASFTPANTNTTNKMKCNTDALPCDSNHSLSQLVLNVVQYPGEAIFVPSGVWHTVENLDDCLSINHNWISTSSAPASWAYLRAKHQKAAVLIADCKELNGIAAFEALVQTNLKAECGLNYVDWGSFLRYIGSTALEKAIRISNGAGVVAAVISSASTDEGNEHDGKVSREAVEEAKQAACRLSVVRPLINELLKEQEHVLKRAGIDHLHGAGLAAEALQAMRMEEDAAKAALRADVELNASVLREIESCHATAKKGTALPELIYT